MTIEGIHHVTSMSGDPARTVAFYRDVLGLRLVKRTVNFDDPSTYHLYFGDSEGRPGTSLTFFPFADGRPGQVGAGQVTTTQFRVPLDSLDFWRDRFADHGVEAGAVTERFGGRVLPFEDEDGLRYELVEDDSDDGHVEPWDDAVRAEHAIRGFHGVELTLPDAGPTVDVLETFGATVDGEDDGRRRYRLRADGPGQVVDVREDPNARPGASGVGTVHHVAFRVPDDEAQADWQATLRERGHRVTDQKDRNYFRSVYFREPGGVLFELATDGPGFTADQDAADLGTALKLPSWLEDDREAIEAQLPPLEAEVSR